MSTVWREHRHTRGKPPPYLPVEARLRELEMANEADDEYEKRHREWQRIMIIWLAILGGLFALDMVLKNALPGVAKTISGLAGCALIFGGIAVAVLRPKRHVASQNRSASNYPTDVRSVDRTTRYSSKDRWLALLLCALFGTLGIHHFYVRRYGMGVLYLFTFGLLLVGWIVDIVRLIKGTFCDAEGRPLVR